MFDIEAAKARLASLENDATAAGIWDDAARAKALLTQLDTIRSARDVRSSCGRIARRSHV